MESRRAEIVQKNWSEKSMSISGSGSDSFYTNNKNYTPK